MEVLARVGTFQGLGRTYEVFDEAQLGRVTERYFIHELEHVAETHQRQDTIQYQCDDTFQTEAEVSQSINLVQDFAVIFVGYVAQYLAHLDPGLLKSQVDTILLHHFFRIHWCLRLQVGLHDAGFLIEC